MGRRREQRIASALPVRIWGMDAQGRPFSSNVRTLDLSRMGGRLGGVQSPLKPGDIIGIQCGNDKARFRVAWIGAPGTALAGQIGVCSVEPTKYIWGVIAPQLVRDNFQPGTARPPAAPEPSPPPASRRAAKRLRCTAGMMIENLRDKVRLWAECTDISRDGCYVETWHPFSVGAEIKFALTFHDLQVRGAGAVKTVHPALGMGIGFTAVEAEDSRRLDQILTRLEGLERQATAEAPPAEDPLAARLQAFASQLGEVEAMLVRCAVDARMLHEFRNSLDHARQTAWAVEQFLELQNQKRDAYHVLSLITEQRVHGAIQLCHELITDIEATEVNFHTEGLQELYDSVRTLLARLEKMFAKPSAA